MDNNESLSGGKSAVTVVTSTARREPTPRSQQAARWKTSEQQDEFTGLFIPFNCSVCSWLLILAYPLLYGSIIKDSWSWYWGFFSSGSSFCPQWWTLQSSVCFPNQQAFLPACKSPKQSRQQDLDSFFSKFSFLIKKEYSLYLIRGFQNVPFNIYLNNLSFMTSVFYLLLYLSTSPVLVPQNVINT